MRKCGNEKCGYYNKGLLDHCGCSSFHVGACQTCPNFQEYDDTDLDGGVCISTKGGGE